jgi:hypothetical protein
LRHLLEGPERMEFLAAAARSAPRLQLLSIRVRSELIRFRRVSLETKTNSGGWFSAVPTIRKLVEYW